MSTNELTSNPVRMMLIGGSWQLQVNGFRDFKKIADFDVAFWALTGIEISVMRFEQKFLEFVDTDKNGKIRTEEVQKALYFMLDALKDGTGVDNASNVLELAAINDATPTGQAILNAAKVILANLGKEDANSITIDEVRNDKLIKSCVNNNGDGIITPDDENNPELSIFIKKIIEVVGSVNDITGAPGVNKDLIDKFATLVAAQIAYQEEKNQVKEILPYGENTAKLCGVVDAIAAPLDSFFLNSESLAFLGEDPARLAKLDISGDVRSADDVKNLLGKLIIAAPNVNCILDFAAPCNPLMRDALDTFAGTAEFQEYFENNTLSAANWRKLKARFAAFRAWKAKNPSQGALDKYSLDELKSFSDVEKLDQLRQFVSDDLATGTALAGAEQLHRILLYQMNMLEFLRNFVNLSSLFNVNRFSMIQAGQLVMDGRRFTLAIPVSNLAEHKKIVSQSDICVIYVEISRGLPNALVKQTLAVAVTSGNVRNIFIGKRGVFFDAASGEFDAKVIDFIEQPVSIGEALKSPFYKLASFVGSQTDKFFASNSAKAQKALGDQIAAGKVPDTKIAQSASPINGSMLLMGGGIGIAALGSSIAFIVKSLQNVSILSIIAVLIGIILIFGGPIVISALIKLYRRNLARFLEAAGCAVNRPMRLSRKLGAVFTHVPECDAIKFDSKDLVDVFSVKENNGSKKFIAFLLYLSYGIVIFAIGYFVFKTYFG